MVDIAPSVLKSFLTEDIPSCQKVIFFKKSTNPYLEDKVCHPGKIGIKSMILKFQNKDLLSKTHTEKDQPMRKIHQFLRNFVFFC